MSDLQEIIASNAVRAYNEGFERGQASEQERIIKLLEEYLHKLLHNHGLVIIQEEFDFLVSCIKMSDPSDSVTV